MILIGVVNLVNFSNCINDVKITATYMQKCYLYISEGRHHKIGK